jgi:hypothetical protein
MPREQIGQDRPSFSAALIARDQIADTPSLPISLRSNAILTALPPHESQLNGKQFFSSFNSFSVVTVKTLLALAVRSV